MPRNPKIACIHILTEEDVEQVTAREERAKANNGNYNCTLCRRFIWWDEPHAHKVGEKVRV